MSVEGKYYENYYKIFLEEVELLLKLFGRIELTVLIFYESSALFVIATARITLIFELSGYSEGGAKIYD